VVGMKRIILAPLPLMMTLTGVAQQTFKLVPPDKSFEITFPANLATNTLRPFTAKPTRILTQALERGSS
jgi:hypothetical protein